MNHIYNLLNNNIYNHFTDIDVLDFLKENKVNYNIHTLKEPISKNNKYTSYRTIIYIEDNEKYLAINWLENHKPKKRNITNIFYYEVVKRTTPVKNLYIIKG